MPDFAPKKSRRQWLPPLLFWFVFVSVTVLATRYFAVRDCLAVATYDQAQLFGTRTVNAMITLGDPQPYRLLSAQVLGAAELLSVARGLQATDPQTLNMDLENAVPLLLVIVSWALLCHIVSIPAMKQIDRLWAVANQRPVAVDSSSRHRRIAVVLYAVSALAIAVLVAFATYYFTLGVASPVVFLEPSTHTLYALVPTVLATFGLGTLWLAVLSRMLRCRQHDLKASSHCPVCSYEVAAAQCPECGWGKTGLWPRGRLLGAVVCVALVWILAMIFPAMVWSGAVFAMQRAVANPVFPSGQPVALFVAGENRAVIFDLPDGSQVLVDVQLQAQDATRESALVWHRASPTTDWRVWGDIAAIAPGMPLVPVGFTAQAMISRAPVQTGFRLALCMQPAPTRLHYAPAEQAEALRAARAIPH